MFLSFYNVVKTYFFASSSVFYYLLKAEIVPLDIYSL